VTPAVDGPRGPSLSVAIHITKLGLVTCRAGPPYFGPNVLNAILTWWRLLSKSRSWLMEERGIKRGRDFSRFSFFGLRVCLILFLLSFFISLKTNVTGPPAPPLLKPGGVYLESGSQMGKGKRRCPKAA